MPEPSQEYCRLPDPHSGWKLSRLDEEKPLDRDTDRQWGEGRSDVLRSLGSQEGEQPSRQMEEPKNDVEDSGEVTTH